MKTDSVSGKGHIPFNKTDQAKEGDQRSEKVNPQKEEDLDSRKKASSNENKNAHLFHMDAVKKMIGENIQWREMRFYRHEADGQMYVDIIDKKTGEVLRTVPEPEFVKIATQFKHLAGMNLNING